MKSAILILEQWNKIYNGKSIYNEDLSKDQNLALSKEIERLSDIVVSNIMKQFQPIGKLESMFEDNIPSEDEVDEDINWDVLYGSIDKHFKAAVMSKLDTKFKKNLI